MTITLRLPVIVDLRVLGWLWSSAAACWHEWHMARMDHDAPPGEWCSRIHKADRWRSVASAAFPRGRS